MNSGTFLMVFFACAGLLALWLDARLGDRSPQTVQKVILHGGCSLLAVNVLTGISAKLISSDARAIGMLALFLVLLPGLMYVFLASIWFLKLVRSAMPR